MGERDARSNSPTHCLKYAAKRSRLPAGDTGERKRRCMLLERKNTVIYGGGGQIGGAVARAFAREGARVFLAGRTAASLEAVAEEIRAAGGAVETAQVDALDEAAVDAHADTVAARAGGIDISFNLISHGDVQGTPLAEMALDDFTRPVLAALRSPFLTPPPPPRHLPPPRARGIL